jgi:hypothetical protein
MKLEMLVALENLPAYGPIPSQVKAHILVGFRGRGDYLGRFDVGVRGRELVRYEPTPDDGKVSLLKCVGYVNVNEKLFRVRCEVLYIFGH